MEKITKWDLFISHASEDKELLVRPLAIALQSIGLKIVYDEFTFRLGDSLSESIDRGIAESAAGLLILSESFFSKPWTKQEKSALLSKLAYEKEHGYILIPLWHGVTREQVGRFSPILADLVAITSDVHGPLDLAMRIAERTRPDLFKAIARRAAFDNLAKKGKAKRVKIGKLKSGPIRHTSLPPGLTNRIRVITALTSKFTKLSLVETLQTYQRELYPDIEIRVWERIVARYLEICGGIEDDSTAQIVFRALLALSFGDSGSVKSLLAELPGSVQQRFIASAQYRPPWDDSPVSR